MTIAAQGQTFTPLASPTRRDSATQAGQLTTLHSFCALTNCIDGDYPESGLVQATDGNFYGTTYQGGASEACPYPAGCGIVFEITPAGQLTTLYSFCSRTGCADGYYPRAGLVQAANGNLYGATYLGGANGLGTLYDITPAGELTTLYNFCSQTNCSDGESPNAGLVQATNGNLYGTTGRGGLYCSGGCGTVFEITPVGKLTFTASVRTLSAPTEPSLTRVCCRPPMGSFTEQQLALAPTAHMARFSKSPLRAN